MQRSLLFVQEHVVYRLKKAYVGKRILPVFLLGLEIWTCSCRSGPTRDPNAVLEAYFEAIEHNEPQKAYALLHPHLQKKVSKTEFQSRWNTYGPELQQQLYLLKKRAERKISIKADAHFSSGIHFKLIHRDGQWFVEEGIAVWGSSSTPYEAIRALMRALKERNIQALLKLLAKEKRDRLETELNDRLKLLEKALEKNIEIMGNRARLQYGPSLTIELIFEQGSWKIVDFK